MEGGLGGLVEAVESGEEAEVFEGGEFVVDGDAVADDADSAAGGAVLPVLFKDVDGAIVTPMKMLPSSSVGINSVPRKGTTATVARSPAKARPTTRFFFRRA